MSVVGSVVLTTAITFTPTTGSSSNVEDALKAVAKATYKQTGLNKMVKRLERKYISDEMRKYGGWAINIGKVFIERKVSYEWTF